MRRTGGSPAAEGEGRIWAAQGRPDIPGPAPDRRLPAAGRGHCGKCPRGGDVRARGGLGAGRGPAPCAAALAQRGRVHRTGRGAGVARSPIQAAVAGARGGGGGEGSEQAGRGGGTPRSLPDTRYEAAQHAAAPCTSRQKQARCAPLGAPTRRYLRQDVARLVDTVLVNPLVGLVAGDLLALLDDVAACGALRRKPCLHWAGRGAAAIKSVRLKNS